MKGLSIVFLVIASLLLSVQCEKDIKSLIKKVVENPKEIFSHFSKSALVCHHLDGRCWDVERFSRSIESVEELSFKSLVDSDIEQFSKMAWIHGDGTNGLVLINSGNNWKIERVNITSENVISRMEKKEKKAELTLKIMSFNIRYGTASDGTNSWYNRDHMVFNLIGEHNPDFLGLQEALLFQIEEIVEAVPKYKWIGVGRDNGAEAGEFSAILYDSSKYDVVEQGTFWYCNQPTVPGCISYGNTIPRICTWGRFISKSTGRLFFHYNTHLDHMSTNSREKSSQQLLDFIHSKQNGEPVFITGDFNNAAENAPEIQTLKNASFEDTFRVLYPNATNVGTFNGFTGNSAGTKIDFVFAAYSSSLGGPFKTSQAEIIQDNENGKYPSDHFPVDATITYV